jgi:hypothetical protein
MLVRRHEPVRGAGAEGRARAGHPF